MALYHIILGQEEAFANKMFYTQSTLDMGQSVARMNRSSRLASAGRRSTCSQKREMTPDPTAFNPVFASYTLPSLRSLQGLLKS